MEHTCPVDPVMLHVVCLLPSECLTKLATLLSWLSASSGSRTENEADGHWQPSSRQVVSPQHIPSPLTWNSDSIWAISSTYQMHRVLSVGVVISVTGCSNCITWAQSGKKCRHGSFFFSDPFLSFLFPSFLCVSPLLSAFLALEGGPY